MRIDRTLLAIGLLLITQMTLAGEARMPPAVQPEESALDELTEVVVTGRFPGPPLWKVSKDDHVLWILPLTVAAATTKENLEMLDYLSLNSPSVIMWSGQCS